MEVGICHRAAMVQHRYLREWYSPTIRQHLNRIREGSEVDQRAKPLDDHVDQTMKMKL